MTTSLSNITVKDGQNTLVVKANDITINGSSILATNNFVTLDTNQTITGVKTITRGIDTTFIQFKNTGMDRTVNPSTPNFTHCKFIDKNALTLGEMYLRDTSTEREIRFIVLDKNGNNRGMLNIGCDSNDNAYTTAVTPATTDNSTKIATTAFVKAQGYLTSHQSLSNYVTLNSAQTISGTKAFSSAVQFANNTLNNIGDDVKVGDGNVGGCLVIQGTNNATGIQLRPQDGTTGNNRKIYLNDDYISLDVTPAVSDNSTKIATTAYCNSKHQVVSALPASPDANVFYYIPA